MSILDQLSFGFGRRLPLILQTEASVACAMRTKWLWRAMAVEERSMRMIQ